MPGLHCPDFQREVLSPPHFRSISTGLTGPRVSATSAHRSSPWNMEGGAVVTSKVSLQLLRTPNSSFSLCAAHLHKRLLWLTGGCSSPSGLACPTLFTLFRHGRPSGQSLAQRIVPLSLFYFQSLMFFRIPGPRIRRLFFVCLSPPYQAATPVPYFRI